LATLKATHPSQPTIFSNFRLLLMGKMSSGLGGSEQQSALPPNTTLSQPSHSLCSLDQPGHHDFCMHADCCYDRGEQDGPSGNLTTPNVLASCLSLHHGCPHDPHDSGKRFFDQPRPPSPGKMASGLGEATSKVLYPHALPYRIPS